jgi:hypothetical protein
MRSRRARHGVAKPQLDLPLVAVEELVHAAVRSNVDVRDVVVIVGNAPSQVGTNRLAFGLLGAGLLLIRDEASTPPPSPRAGRSHPLTR